MPTPQDSLKAIEERRKKKGVVPDVPFYGEDGKPTAAPQPKKKETLGEIYDRNIKEMGGWGLSGETRNALGGNIDAGVLSPIVNAPANVAELGFRALQGLGAGIETGAEKVDELSEASGLADLLSFDGNKFLPGSAVMALGEAFPLGGAEVGLIPTRMPVRDFEAKANDIVARGGGRAELDALAKEAGRQPYGPEVDELLKTRQPFKFGGGEDDLDRVLASRPVERIDYQEPNIPTSVHPEDEFLVPPKGGLESGRGMDERELARYNRRVWNEKRAQEIPENDLSALPADELQLRYLQAKQSNADLTPFNEEFRTRNREEFGVEPVRGGDEPETPIVPQTKKVGGIGAGQGVVPDELAHFGVTKQPSRGREATREAAEDVDFDNEGRIGDVAAIAAKGAQETRVAASDVMSALNKHGPSSDEYLEAVVRFEKAASKHSENSSELGRGLQTLSKGGATKDEIAKFTELASDPKYADKFGKLVAKYQDDPDALKKIARDGANPSIRDRIFSWRYNLMLSGPKTHVYNVVGNTANIAVDIAEHGLAALGGQLRKAAGNRDRVSGREVGARLYGAMLGARQGLKNMKEAYKEGRPLDDANRAEMLHGKVGNLQVPVKALAAEDEFFRSVADVSNTYGMAVRNAVSEGLKGQALKDRVQELVQNPTEDMIKDSGEYSKRMRFQDDPSIIGKSLEMLRTRKSDDTIGAKIGKDAVALLLPFVRTPDSLVRTALRRSPAGFIDGVNGKDWKAGGARRDLALSRVALGSGTVALIASKVLDGEITGEGPRDYKKRQALELDGWQANSVKVGDKYYSYEGLEPLSILLGGTATEMERWDEGSDKGYMTQAANQVMNAAEVLTNQSYAEGLSDFFDALTAPPGQKGAKVNDFFANMGSSFVVPAVVRQANQSFNDPMVRDTRGDDSFPDRLAGRIQSGIPGLSDNLPAQVDALGRERRRGDALGPDFLSRAYSPGEEPTAVSTELRRLMEADPEGKALIGQVPRTVNTKDHPIGRLTAVEHHDYQLVTGAYIDALMTEAMASPEWATMTDDEKRAEIKSMATDARKWAREDVFSAEAPEDQKEEKTSEAAPEGEEFTFGIPTSGLRSDEDNERVGGVPNSAHLDGDALDFVPAKGVSWKKLYAEAKRFFGPEATVIHEKPGYRNGAYHKEHIHVTLPGLGAPEL